MQRIGKFLGKTLKEMRAEDALAAGRVFALWPEIVGPGISERTRPRFLRAGTLVVEVSSAAWASELSLLKPRLLSALEAKLGKGVIKDLRYQVAPTWAPGSREAAELELPALPPEPPVDPERAREIIREIETHVADPKLAQSVGDLMALIERRSEAKRKAGWRPCGTCGALIPPGAGPECPVCRLGRR